MFGSLKMTFKVCTSLTTLNIRKNDEFWCNDGQKLYNFQTLFRSWHCHSLESKVLSIFHLLFFLLMMMRQIAHEKVVYYGGEKKFLHFHSIFYDCVATSMICHDLLEKINWLSKMMQIGFRCSIIAFLGVINDFWDKYTWTWDLLTGFELLNSRLMRLKT